MSAAATEAGDGFLGDSQAGLAEEVDSFVEIRCRGPILHDTAEEEKPDGDPSDADWHGSLDEPGVARGGAGFVPGFLQQAMAGSCAEARAGFIRKDGAAEGVRGGGARRREAELVHEAKLEACGDLEVALEGPQFRRLGEALVEGLADNARHGRERRRGGVF